MQRDTRLSVRAEAVRLAPAAPGHRPEATWTRLLAAEAHAAAWRLVEASSRDAQPFDLELTWSAGDGSGATARISVASASRVCLFARHLDVRGRAAGPAEARVALHIADGFAPTHNVWSLVGPAGEVATVPPFARTVWADVAEGALADDAFLVLDGPAGTLAEVRLDRQPSAGVPIAGVTAVSVRTTRPVPVRLAFHLHL